MDIIERGLDWLGDELTVAGTVAILLVAFTLLSAFAAAFRQSREGARLTPTKVEPESVADGGSDAVLHQTGSVEEPPEQPMVARLAGRGVRLRGRPFLQDNLLFLSRWANAPLQVGSVTPSGRALGRAMAAELPAQYRVCVELGGGTGSLTRALLAAGVPREALIVIERDPRLAAYLRRRFPKVRIVLGDARRLSELLASQGIESVDAVVSSLPLRSLPRRVGEAIVAESFRVLARDGVYVQYTYALQPPVREDAAQRLCLLGEARKRVWNNLPPATVWRYRRAVV